MAKKATKKVAKKAANKVAKKAAPKKVNPAIKAPALTDQEKALIKLEKKLETFCKKNNIHIIGAIAMPDCESFGRTIINPPKSALELLALKTICEKGI